MRITGIIAEFDPLHPGHAYILRAAREMSDGVVCVMSGNIVQRGNFALVGRLARAEAAVRCGADLVLELPLQWAVSSAERFADGGVQVLNATGIVTDLLFGSECGNIASLESLAKIFDTPEYQQELKSRLSGGKSYPVHRQEALSALAGAEQAALLESPNNNLGVEYCRAVYRQKANLRIHTVFRLASHHAGEIREAVRESVYGHSSGDIQSGFPGNILENTKNISNILSVPARERALQGMTPEMTEIYQREESSGKAPVFMENNQRGILSCLRRMSERDFARLDSGHEGLYRRLYQASRNACDIHILLSQAKTRRCTHSRLRRMVMWAYLGLRPGEFPEKLAYIRVLAANTMGCHLLARMRKSARVPIITKPAAVRKLDTDAQRLFQQESVATDLYALAYPDIRQAAGGSLFRETAVILT